MYRHIYGFKFKEDATEQQISDCLAAFRKMKAEMPEIADATMGPNINVSRAPKFYPWIFSMDFRNYDDYRSWEDSAQHKAFVQEHLVALVERRTGPMDLEV